MADHQQRALEAPQRLLQRLARGDVEVVGGLVQGQHVAREQHHLGHAPAGCARRPTGPRTERKGSSPKKRNLARYWRTTSGDRSARTDLDLVDQRALLVQRAQLLIEVAEPHAAAALRPRPPAAAARPPASSAAWTCRSRWARRCPPDRRGRC